MTLFISKLIKILFIFEIKNMSVDIVYYKVKPHLQIFKVEFIIKMFGNKS